MNKISLLTLTMLITGAIDNIRNLPTTALFGSTLIFFCIFAAIVFLIPTALVSAELTAKFPEKGGVFHWARLAFGDNIAFLTVWLQWINTMVWYPTFLAFIAGTIAYLINPALIENKLYLVSAILIVFWAQTLISLRGFHLSAKFSSICTIIGTVIPMLAVIVLGVIWLFKHNPTHIVFTAHSLLPNLSHSENWISLTAIMASYLGMELASVHVNEIKDPKRNFPKALLASVVIILATIICGSLAIAIVMSPQQINLVGGLFQAFQIFLNAYGLAPYLPVLVVMVLIGSIGGLTNWVMSPAKGLLQSAELGFLPKWLRHKNKNDVASHVLILQAILVSLLSIGFLVLPSINGSYWLLTDMSTQLYILMYIILFFSAIAIKCKFHHIKTGLLMGGKKPFVIVSLLGLFGCAVSLIVGFIPPDGINVGSVLHFELTFGLGMLAMIIPVFFFYGYRKFASKSHQ